MPQLSPAIAESARKNERAILLGLSKVTQTKVAELMGVSDTKVSRFKGPDLEEIGALLAACGLKAVPSDMQCFPREKVHALLTLARDHLQQIEHPEQLIWD